MARVSETLNNSISKMVVHQAKDRLAFLEIGIRGEEQGPTFVSQMETYGSDDQV